MASKSGVQSLIADQSSDGKVRPGRFAPFLQTTTSSSSFGVHYAPNLRFCLMDGIGLSPTFYSRGCQCWTTSDPRSGSFPRSLALPTVLYMRSLRLLCSPQFSPLTISSAHTRFDFFCAPEASLRTFDDEGAFSPHAHYLYPVRSLLALSPRLSHCGASSGPPCALP